VAYLPEGDFPLSASKNEIKKGGKRKRNKGREKDTENWYRPEKIPGTPMT